MNNFYYLEEYLPKRFAATQKQEYDRQTCYAFKKGVLFPNIQGEFLRKINEITHSSAKNWVICFIPASTAQKTATRFGRLANAIRNAGYEVEQDAIFNVYDKESEHLAGKSANPIETFGFNKDRFFGKNVILIDDIITRGRTFNMSADIMVSLGAVSVTGLFLAKTIHPSITTGYYEGELYDEADFYDDYDEPDPDDYCDEPDYDEFYDEPY